MAKRRHYRRRRKSILKPRKGTIFSLLSLFLIIGSILLTLSFFQQGSVLDSLQFTADYYFGVMKYLLPILGLTFSLSFLKLKISLTRPNILLGLLLVFFCLSGLTQSGVVGTFIWLIASDRISEIGSFVMISLMLFVGLMVLFDISLAEIVKVAESVLELFEKLPVKTKKKDLFADKLPIRPPPVPRLTNTPIEKEISDREKSKAPKAPAQLPGTPGDLGSSVVTNLNASEEVWEYPPLSLLASAPGQKADRGDMKQNAQTIEQTLESFGINARVVEVNLGPAVTQYALEIALGNRSLEFVTVKQMLSSDSMKRGKNKLLVALGLDVSGSPVVGNIAKMPHVLIAGTTGSGKSVLINSWIASILFRNSPSEVRLILVDPKRVELTLYKDIPHLLTPVIVEPDKILSALKWSMSEMDRRYKLFSEVGVRNIDHYNELSGFQALPYIIIFIDELADLMSYAPVEVEDSICRIAQMARATGIHLVVATQRPSVDVITGLIKANIPSRIAFNVSSMIDSRVIIDMPGAEKLLGRGDMLYIPPDQAKPTRIQGTYVNEGEIAKLVEYMKNKNVPVEYTEEVTSMAPTWKKGAGGPAGTTGEDGHDALFEQAVRVVCQYDRASASLLQRRLSIGYARAARVLDQLEAEGIVGMAEGSKPRDVLVKNPDEFFAGKNEPEPAA
ncbi:MAG: cell division protein ftsK/spoIIIE, DNA segregation ATPase FtsK/SpoIIIE, S-DNA-T family [Candidatus Gottesmanbacteria bacterium GW2011_GWA2_43_14]|uniref:Cell division protein ftsK/spoIIIE, DNA segregation ATPase FtsK/SpoIIIE, S-DNA-T family n=1 Tax=Candidatus Gottesmanbacteria bacterium GW2011_GWA2_43_14 TaxID=1618443 RepID=A0A0G1DED9_9BACT|nr:MAG: cell division protein ftsK/spoIIIE, DNA segregation ATPase FtsK/SpoIIIE, S-DNA-T family [Candidatus Gottesmanbacteria bacterium GW2011_GWA2_43_14]